MLQIKRRIPDESNLPISEIIASGDTAAYDCRVEFPGGLGGYPILVRIGRKPSYHNPMSVAEVREAIEMLELAVAEVERRGR